MQENATPRDWPELFTLDQAAEYMNSSKRFARRLVDEKRIRVHKLGRWVRIARADLDAYLAAHVREAREEPRLLVHATGRERPDGTISVGNPPREYENRAHFLDNYQDDANLDDYELRFDEVTDATLGRFFQVLIDA
jgi:excisionase family DNA binding protein